MIKRIVAFLTAWVLLLGLCACGRSISGQADSAGQATWEEQYELGLRYLSEGDYEGAIIAFTAAIEIDPKRAEAYVGRGDAYMLSGESRSNLRAARADYKKALNLGEDNAELYRKAAEVCIALDDIEAAVKLLERGLEDTGDSDLQDALDKLAGAITPSELVQGSEEWNSLEEFLAQFAWCATYDCETTFYGVLGNENIMEGLLKQNRTTGSPYNDERYPGEANEEVWYEYELLDPLGKWESYTKVNSDKLEWILRHIFNCSQSDIEKMKAEILAGPYEFIYYLDGYYYYAINGFGIIAPWSVITGIEQKGMRYYVEYELWYQEPGDDPEDIDNILLGTCRAEVSLKEIDGKTYWSLYRGSGERIN